MTDALRKPQVRGSWGEQHLRWTLEMAGLTEHCDFDTQVTVAEGRDTFRPDVVIHLVGGKSVVVDAKVSFDALLDAEKAATDTERDRHLAEATRADENLWQYAAGRRVLLVTPTTLLATLHVIGHMWRQEALAENMAEIAKLGRGVYERLITFRDHLDQLGKSLDGSLRAYNETIGSLERRVLPAESRMRELKVSEKPLPRPRIVEGTARRPAMPELTAPADSQPPAGQGQ